MMKNSLVVLVVFGLVLVSGCVAEDKSFSDAQSACTSSGGTYELSDCNGHCTPDTKEQRLLCEEKGCMCTTVCMEGYKCTCPAGKKWGSKEEGCIGEANTVEETAKAKCVELCKENLSFENALDRIEDTWSQGPCLSEDSSDWKINDWVCDVAHSPRADVDDLPENQCKNFLEGKAHHFVEVTPQCELIKAI